MRLVFIAATSLAALLLWGCTGIYAERNPFLSYSDHYGIAGQQEESTDGGGTGMEVAGRFRRDLTITFRNNSTQADLNTTLVAWVNPSSIRSAQQQDALLRAGYSQLTEEARLGLAFTLPVGTLVFDGGGTAGATSIFLRRAAGTGAGEGETEEAGIPTTTSITLTTPDVILVFSQPPVSCDSVAFYFTRDGEPLTGVSASGPESPYAGAATGGAFKTLAQVDVYQCSPLRPGLFLSLGGARQSNEYYEGQNITFDFNLLPDANGNCAVVTIGAPSAAQP